MKFQTNQKLILIEKDPSLAKELKIFEEKNVFIYNQDILNFNIEKFVKIQLFLQLTI